MMERRRVQARGLVFDFLAAGGAVGEPVLLLHGFPQTAACWTQLAGALTDAGYRVLAPDQRGYSPGAWPAAVRDYQMPELVADVLALADRAGNSTSRLAQPPARHRLQSKPTRPAALTLTNL